MKQAADIANRHAQRTTESRFEPPALSVEPTTETSAPAESAAAYSIATTDVIPGLRSVTPKIQRKENDDGSPAPTPVPAPPPDAPGSKAEPLNAGATGTTNILAPTVSSKTYSGKTLKEVSGALPDESGSLTFNISAATDGDPITKATVTVSQTMVLPEWAERDKQCKPIQAAWDRFASALRTHENEHVKINRQQLGSAHDRFVGKAKSETQEVTTELENETFAANNAFDSQTDHGRSGNPSTTIDVGTKCDSKNTDSGADPGAETGGPEGEEPVQMKLEVSEPGDPDEEEADRLAEQVMRMAEPRDSASIGVFGGAKVVQRCAACEAEEEKWKASGQVGDGARIRRKCAECEAKEKGERGKGEGERETGEGDQGEETKKGRVQRKESNGRSVVDESSRVTAVARSGGQPLDAGTRAFMEPRFGFDFGRVRIHADCDAAGAARSVNAHAYTLGNEIVFAAGRYAPHALDGRRLLAHELTHVVQQAQTADRGFVSRQVAAAGGGGSGFDPRCLEILGRILSFLYGGANHVVGTVGVIGPNLHRGVMERYAQLLEDPRNLYLNNRTVAQADPKYGSWEGHQRALEGQQIGLRNALEDWRTHCGGPGGGGVPQEAAHVIKTANTWATRPVPDRPRTLASIQPPERRYTLTLQHAGGSNLTQDQAAAAINEELVWDTNRVNQLSGEHELLKQNREEHYVVGWMADVVGGVDIPPLSIWDEARAKLAAAKAANGGKNIDGAMASLVEYERAVTTARKQYLTYKEGTLSGAEAVKIGAEVIAVAAAVVFVAAGGAILLGVGAGAGATAATGAAASAATTTGAAAGGATTTVTVIAATDSAAAANVLSAALTASAETTVSAELLTAAGEAAPWIAEDVEFMSMVQ